MSWTAIAKKDVQDSIRSRILWGMIGFFLIVVLLLSWLVVDTSGSGEDTLLAAAGFTFILGILFFIPIAGLLLSVKSVVRERNTGTINLLLSLPHTRRDMIVGKFVGRSIVMGVTVLAGFLPALLYILVQSDGFPVLDLGWFLVVACLFGVLWIGIGVGLSALVDTETQATIGGVILFFVLFLWPVIIEQLGLTLPDFASRFWLFTMFSDLFLLFSVFRDGMFTYPSVVKLDEVIQEEIADVSISVAPHMQMWFVFVLLALFVIVPLVAGYYRFNSADL
jgi:ABC-2 type transport system permease protein